jgi:hypothetical protein
MYFKNKKKIFFLEKFSYLELELQWEFHEVVSNPK